MSDKIYSVSELNREVKNYLEENIDFSNFFLKGELSGVNYYRSGHLYFTLKDKNCQVKCAAFSYKYKKIPKDLKEGDSVKILGSVGFYENRGDFQILVNSIEKENEIGELYQKLEKVKKEFEEKGYFSPMFKKQLPKYPKAIGVVTSINGAALHDIINTTRKRMKNVDIYIYPAKVQGIGSKEEIVKGIETLDKIPEIDIIIAGRGGGSIEDLWAFNEREVGEAFFRCNKPIISAVVHEVDFLLSDLVADVRAATPTQSAEICIPAKENIDKNLIQKKNYLQNLILGKIKTERKQINNLKNSFVLKKFPNRTNDYKNDIIYKERELTKAFSSLFEKKKQIFISKTEKLINLNPLQTLTRGYSITEKNNKGIKSISDINIGDEIKTILSDGSFISIIKEIN